MHHHPPSPHHRGAAKAEYSRLSPPTIVAEANDFSHLRDWHSTCIGTMTMPVILRIACLLCISLCLKGCAPMLALAGYHQTVVQVVAQVERVKLAGDGVSYVASSKTITDHALSAVVGRDCKIF